MTMEGVPGNPWSILGVPFGSSYETSRAAYRRLAMTYHPDRNPGDEEAKARLVALNLAWAKISNEPKSVRPTSPFAAAFEDLVRDSEDFEAALRPGEPERGLDAEAVVHLRFAESLADRQHTLTARASDGRVRTTTVVIPGAVTDGETIVFRGLGEPGKAGGGRGDLRLKIAVEPGTGFELRGLDVHREIKLPVWDAALGCEIAVPLPRGGSRRLRLPAGSAATFECRIAGEGASTGASRGDYVVLVSVQVPDAVSDPKLSKLFAAMRPGRLVAA
jgi:curved DNA-binding protein